MALRITAPTNDQQENKPDIGKLTAVESVAQTMQLSNEEQKGLSRVVDNPGRYINFRIRADVHFALKVTANRREISIQKIIEMGLKALITGG